MTKKFSLLLFTLLYFCGNVLAWDGVDPLNYYYLKNVAVNKYIHKLDSKSNNQYFNLTSKEDATLFTINQFNVSTNTWPTTFTFVEGSDIKWLGTNGGDKSEKKS